MLASAGFAECVAENELTYIHMNIKISDVAVVLLACSWFVVNCKNDLFSSLPPNAKGSQRWTGPVLGNGLDLRARELEEENWKEFSNGNRSSTVLFSGWKQRIKKQGTWTYTHTNSGWSFCSNLPWSILKFRLVSGSQKGRSNNSKLMCHKMLRQRDAFTVDSRHSTATE